MNLNKKIFLGLFTAAMAFSFFGLSGTAFADPASSFVDPSKPVNEKDTVGTNDPTKLNFQIVPCKGVDDPTTSINEECTYEKLIYMVQRIIQFALYLLIPIVLGMILWIGFKFLTANGDSGKLADAKKMIKPLLIGIIMIFTAWLIVYTFLDKILSDQLQKAIVPDSIKTSR